jgi:hypothetical protein
MLSGTNICRRCRDGKHVECNGLIIKRVKKAFFKGFNEIETSNKCECPCCGISKESTNHFRENLGPDIRETKHR